MDEEYNYGLSNHDMIHPFLRKMNMSLHIIFFIIIILQFKTIQHLTIIKYGKIKKMMFILLFIIYSFIQYVHFFQENLVGCMQEL